MITEDYVSFETAKLLKEKGFNEPCFAYYSKYIDEWRILKLWKRYPKTYDTVKNDGYILVPTLQMTMKWLREVHNIDIIAPPQYDNVKWTYSAIIFKLSIPCTEIRLNDNKDKKEEACEAAIKYCLKHLI